MTARFCCLLSALVLLPAATSVQASHPSHFHEWCLRTNGLGWGEGYHANNGCCKQGVMPRSYAPGPDAGNYYYGFMHAGFPGGGYSSPYPTPTQHPYSQPQPQPRQMMMPMGHP